MLHPAYFLQLLHEIQAVNSSLSGCVVVMVTLSLQIVVVGTTFSCCMLSLLGKRRTEASRSFCRQEKQRIVAKTFTLTKKSKALFLVVLRREIDAFPITANNQ